MLLGWEVENPYIPLDVTATIRSHFVSHFVTYNDKLGGRKETDRNKLCCILKNVDV